jgi:hypothetical protein
MSHTISKEEAERQARFTTEQALFQLGKTVQMQEITTNNKLKIKKKLFSNFIPPKITDKIFTSSNYTNVLNSIRNDQVHFVVKNYYEYKILAGGKTIEECRINKKKKIVSNATKYIIVESWKTNFNNKEESHQIYIRNDNTGRTMSNSFTFHLQSLNKIDIICDNYHIITLDKPLQIQDTSVNHLTVIDIQKKPIKLESVKELLLVDYFHRNDINQLQNKLNLKTNECSALDEIADGYIKEIEHYETIIKSKETIIKIQYQQMKQIPYFTFILLSFLFAMNAFSLYAAMYGFEQLTIDTSDYILYPIYIVLHLFYTTFILVGILVGTFVINNQYLLAMILVYLTINIITRVFFYNSKN